MAEPQSDPTDGPPLSALSTPLTDLSSLPEPEPLSNYPSQPFYIQVPVFSADKKSQYASSHLPEAVEINLTEIIGEYHDGDHQYYYGRCHGSFAHKFPAQALKVKYRHLITEYKNRKAKRRLDPFDPNADYVHPSSRLTIHLNISSSGATSRISSERSVTSGDIQYVPDSEEEANNSTYSQPARSRIKRREASKVASKALPFSPKKTRSRRVFTNSGSDNDPTASDDEMESRSTRPTRRSNRKRVLRLPAMDTSDGEEEGSNYSPTTSRQQEKRKAPRRKAARPAYGFVRSVADLDYDSDSEDESALLRKHRDLCEKCLAQPAHRLLAKLAKRPQKKGKGKRKSREDSFELSDDEEQRYTSLGGWVRCLKCPVAAHWRCLAATQRDEILKAARVKDLASNPEGVESSRRKDLTPDQTTEFICGACIKGGICMGCSETAIEAEQPAMPDTAAPLEGGSTDAMEGIISENKAPVEESSSAELLFRCLTCKRLCHYQHLADPGDSHDASKYDLASHYQQNWLCWDCASYQYELDKIIAWRPYPPTAIQPEGDDETRYYKTPLPREYLVKWVGRSYRRTQWVPHMWLVSTAPAKLKNFVVGGSKVRLVDATREEEPAIGQEFTEQSLAMDGSRASSSKPGTETPVTAKTAVPDAQQRIPLAWKTVDRILDVRLWKRPTTTQPRKNPRIVQSERGSSGEEVPEKKDAFDHGEQPSEELLETVAEWEAQTDKTFGIDKIKDVVWAFIKWEDLGYDEATWDSPPREGERGYEAFSRALERFAASRQVAIPKLTKEEASKFDKRVKNGYRISHVLKDAADLDLGQDPKLKLMPFQVDGFNWLCDNWWNHQHCILADEMGLGKTVQIATFLGKLALSFKASPALVVVPNSTIGNWVREIERWAPLLRVVPFYGEAKSRDIIKQFELAHERPASKTTGAKFHVLVATYETLLNAKDFTLVFKKQPRWEILIVDEGQRLKSDSSLLFKKLNELNSVHRILMTGTPLNNNMRELFNLMNFLDPIEWSDLQGLEKEHEELTEELLKNLHARLRPYFLRRIKSEVLKLPPKNEVIVPLTMAPLQKEIYRSILTHNADLLGGLAQLASTRPGFASSKGKLNNVLMHLRKCLQHPYLYSDEIEPKALAPDEAHEKLIDGSAKFRFLKGLLPKLKERGHRVLLFSQFVIALDVIEDFLNGEGYKYLRLDGKTHGKDRQTGMDEFNRAGSDVFIYLLTTRAGGVGINLFSADTVIIFDPDFNPHQDLQAIARAYRYGQQKTCLVFKLMVKASAEERIIQIGKKKLVLDHLIVQKINDDDSAGDDVQSILTFGAQALFTEDNSRDIVYSDQDITKLIERTEEEGEQVEADKEGGNAFAFAKIWVADKDALEEVDDKDQVDSWAQTLEKITAEREKMQVHEVAQSGRGARRKAVAKVNPNVYLEGGDVPPKPAGKKPTRAGSSDGSQYKGSIVESSESDSDNERAHLMSDLDLPIPGPAPIFQEPPPVSVNRGGVIASSLAEWQGLFDCGLCGQRHGEGAGVCMMADSSANLAEFREMLILHAGDEPWEQRLAAVRAIDEALNRRGHLHLIVGQPLHPIRETKLAPAKVNGASSSEPHINRAVPQNNVSKRPTSSSATAGPSKKPRPSVIPSTTCLVCRQGPHHLIKDCPEVLKGPKGVSAQIKRLENDSSGAAADVVRSLRKILAKQMKNLERARDQEDVHMEGE